MEMALEAATLMQDPKITEAIEDLYDRIGDDEAQIRSVTLIALLGNPNDKDSDRVEFGIDQGDTPVHLRMLAHAVSGQDPALPLDERAPALRGAYGHRPADRHLLAHP